MIPQRQNITEKITNDIKTKTELQGICAVALVCQGLKGTEEAYVTICETKIFWEMI